MASGTTNALVSTFSGADVVCIFGDQYVGECMSFTVGVNREAGPLYTMGRKEPIAIPKGKRGIGGSFILAQLGYDALLNHWKSVISTQSEQNIWIRKDELVSESGSTKRNISTNGTNGFQDPTTQLTNGVVGSIGAVSTDLWSNLGAGEGPNYVDQMPPFNVTVVGMNEQGAKMGFRVYGVTIINEGMAISIEELNMEKRYTFIAQAISKLTRLDVPTA